MQQKELKNRIEITGMKLNSADRKSDAIEVAKKLFSELNLKVEPSCIAFTFLKRIPVSKGSSESIDQLNVEFSTFRAKLDTIKAKKNLEAGNGIYFDNALTAHNRSLMGPVKKIVKAKNVFVYLSNSKIIAKKDVHHVKAIECDADIEIVKGWPANVKASSQSSSSPVNNI